MNKKSESLMIEDVKHVGKQHDNFAVVFHCFQVFVFNFTAIFHARWYCLWKCAASVGYGQLGSCCERQGVAVQLAKGFAVTRRNNI